MAQFAEAMAQGDAAMAKLILKQPELLAGHKQRPNAIFRFRWARSCAPAPASSAADLANAAALEGRGCVGAVALVARQYASGTPAAAALLGQLSSRLGAVLAAAISDARVPISGSIVAANHGICPHGLVLRQLAGEVAEAAPAPPPGLGLVRGEDGWVARVLAGRTANAARNTGPPSALRSHQADRATRPTPTRSALRAPLTRRRCPAPALDQNLSPLGPPPSDAHPMTSQDRGTRLTTPPCPAPIPSRHPPPRPETRSPLPALPRPQLRV